MSEAAPGSAQLPRPGDLIAGKYVLDRLLGQGGMGAVFAAKHIKLSKAVAIKIMLADASNPEAAQRFINEGRAAANIQNEHVVRVDDVDEEMGYAYMVLELLDGEDLSQLLEREPTRRLPPNVVVDYVVQALKGVMQAHAIGIVHRDLKPSNLFLARRKDGSSVVKVLDFGISKAHGSSALAASPSGLTSTKAMLGSPLYMSPEQLRSSKTVDQRADIWAVGVILYELITGGLPFMGETLGELFAAILETDPAPLRTRAEGVPPGLDEVVLRCLQRRPEHRFQSASELANALMPFTVPQSGLRNSSPDALPFGTMAMAPPQAFGTGQQMRMTPGTGGMDLQVAAAAAIPGGTTGGWQSTGGGPAPAAKKPVVVMAMMGAALFLVSVIGGGVFLITKSKSAVPLAVAASGATSVVSATPVVPSPVVPPPVVPPPASSETAVPPVVASAAPSATLHAPPTSTAKSTRGGGSVAKGDSPKPAEPTRPAPKPDLLQDKR